jgi:biopolymer transport protein TolR
MPALVSRGRGRRMINEINMVPFIDVMLVLLIIFMVTAPLIAPSMIKLPTVDKGAQPPRQIIEILINKDESLQFKNAGSSVPVALEQVGAMAKNAQGTAPAGDSAVLISADGAVKYETVVRVMNALKRSDVDRVGLSVSMKK